MSERYQVKTNIPKKEFLQPAKQKQTVNFAFLQRWLQPMLSNPRALMPVEASKIILGNMEVLSTKEGQNIAMSILDGIYCNLDNKQRIQYLRLINYLLPDNVFLNAFKSHLVRIFTQMFQMYYKEHAADKMEEMKILYKLWIIRVDERVLGLIKHCIKGHCKVDIETSLHPTSMNLVRQGYLALGMSQQEINIKVFKWKPPRSHHEKNPKDRREKINPVSSQKIQCFSTQKIENFTSKTVESFSQKQVENVSQQKIESLPFQYTESVGFQDIESDVDQKPTSPKPESKKLKMDPRLRRVPAVNNSEPLPKVFDTLLISTESFVDSMNVCRAMTKWNNYGCFVCGMSFLLKSNRNSHLKEHFLDNLETNNQRTHSYRRIRNVLLTVKAWVGEQGQLQYNQLLQQLEEFPHQTIKTSDNSNENKAKEEKYCEDKGQDSSQAESITKEKYPKESSISREQIRVKPKSLTSLAVSTSQEKECCLCKNGFKVEMIKDKWCFKRCASASLISGADVFNICQIHGDGLTALLSPQQ